MSDVFASLKVLEARTADGQIVPARMEPTTGDAPIWHVYPCHADGTTDHAVDGDACWCQPARKVWCPQCDRDGSACWRCDGHDMVEAGSIDRPLLVIHDPLKRPGTP